MCKSFSIACFFVLMIGVLIGCQSGDKTEQASQSSLQTNGANVEPKADAAQHQYRALCIEKEQHGGNEYVLSKWMDSRDKANELGQYHGDFKYKGHRWRIEERVKSEQAQP
jgi:hypothetical protein